MALILTITPQDWHFVAGVALGVLLTSAYEMIHEVLLAARVRRRNLRQPQCDD